ncbi:Purple acid phosphatase 22 [Linum grandiflorum]
MEKHASTDFEQFPLSARVFFTPHHRSPSDPQQVHISIAGSDHIKVTWITDDRTVLSTVEYGTEPGNYNDKVFGDRSSYQFLTYTSGSIHHVRIGPLEPNTTYYYRCGGHGPEFSFKTPPSTFPLEIAVVGDLGQTDWTKSTLQGLGKRDYDVFLLPGDLSYANRRQPMWDSFGRLVEPYASRRPWMVTQGNHEMEGGLLFVETNDVFKSYNARWLMPHKQSGSTSNLYYSFDVLGAHIIMLGSCTDFELGSDQYKWLVADLARVDRRATPWLIVSVHMPWYNTNHAHHGDGEAMRVAMEELLYNAKVDIVFAGHVHAYERFTRVYDNKVNLDGPVYITIGTGGYHGGIESSFESPASALSMYRDPSFGHGRLRIVNEKRAQWTWHRNDDLDFDIIADELWLTCLSTSSNDE